MITNLKIYVPRLEDYWYEQKLQSDPNTMSYNAGWDVSYDGYHYDTGCIDFPKSKWEDTFNKRKNENKFFAYLKDTNINEYVGYINYHYNENENKYYCGILIESKYRGKGYSKQGLKLLCDYAKEHGVTELYDDFEIDRNGIKIFEDLGFKIVNKYNAKRFDKDIEIVVVKKVL